MTDVEVMAEIWRELQAFGLMTITPMLYFELGVLITITLVVAMARSLSVLGPWSSERIKRLGWFAHD